MQRITGSTADAVVQAMYPRTSDLLKRFELVKKQANVADAERDRLRKYIQEHVEPGKYDDVIIAMTTTAEQMYVNAEGKFALKNAAIVAPQDGRPDGGIEVVMLAIRAYDAKELVDTFLHQLQKSKENLVSFIKERFVCSGLTMDNDQFYAEKGGTKIDIMVLPPPASQEAQDGTTRPD